MTFIQSCVAYTEVDWAGNLLL